MSAALSKKIKKAIASSSLDIDENSSSSELSAPDLTEISNNGKFAQSKKRAREDSFPPTESENLQDLNKSEKLSRLRWSNDMEKGLTECVEQHVRITPGKGLRQVDWNAVFEEMSSKYPLFGLTRKALKNKYQRLGNIQPSGELVAMTSAAEDNEEDSDQAGPKSEASLTKSRAPKTPNVPSLSVDSILAADKEAFLISQAINEFNTEQRYSALREDPRKALKIIENLMNYENTKKFFLVKPESLRVLFVEKWVQSSNNSSDN